MLLKSVTKTRWTITADRITIRPYGRLYIDSIMIALVGIGVFIWLYHFSDFAKTDHGKAPLLVAFGILFFLIVTLGYANTLIEFDHQSGIMRKKLWGFATVSKIPFSELQEISKVGAKDIYGESYAYRIFKKDNRFGPGFVISRNYRKKENSNAIAFTKEVVPAIHNSLRQHHKTLYDVAPPVMLSYYYFVYENGSYLLKSKKIGIVILGAFFILLGTSFFTVIPQSPIAAIIVGTLFFFFGFFCITAVFTKVIFSKAAQTIERTGMIGYLNKHYHFEDFIGIETVRIYTNFIYTRTAVNLRFNKPGKPGQADILTIASLRTSKQLEQFVHEFYQITGLNNDEIKQNIQSFH
ncbi:hypothetical protein GJU39_18865 [Pedobacter petrophilus]|uniref:Uncharacterized protein n=1 Tax=Pedobacter petrophilus TaxID=1908241 RepID=A0A7K0G2V5_9SPHI|nr:hypothetical protein [Pedobacter petrophilus]MRX78145.1 hypothetical protein [Pedobacter petrophilus]